MVDVDPHRSQMNCGLLHPYVGVMRLKPKHPGKKANIEILILGFYKSTSKYSIEDRFELKMLIFQNKHYFTVLKNCLELQKLFYQASNPQSPDIF